VLTDEKCIMSYSSNHWASKETMIEWVDQLLLPYYARVKEELGRPADASAVLILDCWKVHLTQMCC
jgi:hypothetical protein